MKHQVLEHLIDHAGVTTGAPSKNVRNALASALISSRSLHVHELDSDLEKPVPPRSLPADLPERSPTE